LLADAEGTPPPKLESKFVKSFSLLDLKAFYLYFFKIIKELGSLNSGSFI